jgi:predicted secreted protein
MAISTAIAIYFLIWWIVLFAVLPWGVRAQGEESPPGTDPGAPMVPRLLNKLIWTTAVATVVWGLCAVAYLNGFVTLDGLAALMGLPELNKVR